MRALVTGINGFVGEYLKNELQNNGYEVVGLDIISSEATVTADLTDEAAVFKAIKETKPDCIFHLAGQSSVALSWSKPSETLEINCKSVVNLIKAVSESNKDIKILSIGSSEQYGIVKMEDCPVKETHPTKPANPYAISKQCVEDIGIALAKKLGIKMVFTRSFNHTGPGQPRGFVIPDFASKIVEIEQGKEQLLFVGNLDVKRDFSDVRDVVKAYRLLVEYGAAYEVYNVGSGIAYTVSELLNRLISISGTNVEIAIDSNKLRPSDMPVIVCDNRKLAECTGYEQKYNIDDTLADTLDYWRMKKEGR